MRFWTTSALGLVFLAMAFGTTGEGASARLAWAPPALSNPVNITVTNANRRLFLDDSRDYRLHIAEHLKRELWIEGGRNVVVIGGHITLDQLGTASSYQDNTAVKVRYGAAGATVHLEGLLIDGAYVNDGIVTSTSRNLQIQNVRVERAYDMIKNGHADCFQSQLGVGHLRVDRFTCTTTRQGFFLGNHDGPIASADLRRINVVGTPGTHLLWQSTPSSPVSLSDVVLGMAPETQPWAPFGFWVYPQRDGRTYTGEVDRRRRAVVSRDGKLLWFVGSRISGVVRRPPAGALDFVPAGVAGMAYASPGYARPSRG